MVAAAGVLGGMLVPLSVPVTATASTTTTTTSAVGATATSAAAGQWHMVRGRIMDNVEVAGNTTVTVTVAGKGWLPSSNLASSPEPTPALHHAPRNTAPNDPPPNHPQGET
jgi:hypothetical protein